MPGLLLGTQQLSWPCCLLPARLQACQLFDVLPSWLGTSAVPGGCQEKDEELFGGGVGLLWL
jgi:hypothetical protein